MELDVILWVGAVVVTCFAITMLLGGLNSGGTRKTFLGIAQGLLAIALLVSAVIGYSMVSKQVSGQLQEWKDDLTPASTAYGSAEEEISFREFAKRAQKRKFAVSYDPYLTVTLPTEEVGLSPQQEKELTNKMMKAKMKNYKATDVTYVANKAETEVLNVIATVEVTEHINVKVKKTVVDPKTKTVTIKEEIDIAEERQLYLVDLGSMNAEGTAKWLNDIGTMLPGRGRARIHTPLLKPGSVTEVVRIK